MDRTSAIGVEGVSNDTGLQLVQQVRAGSVATPLTFSGYPGPIEQFAGDVYIVIARSYLPDGLRHRGQSLGCIEPDPLSANDFEPLAHICVQMGRDSVPIYSTSVACLDRG